MNLTDLIGTGAVALGVSAAALGWQWTRIESRMKRAKLTPVAQIRDGQRARICGVVRGLAEPARAALTGRPCAYYVVTVLEASSKTASGALRDVGSSAITDAGGVPFLLQDDSGTAIIEPHAAVVKQMWPDTVGLADDFDTERVDELLARQGFPSPSRAWRSSLQLSESILAFDETVDVVGAGIREADPDGASDGYRSTPTRVRMAATRTSPLWIVKAARSTREAGA